MKKQKRTAKYKKTKNFILELPLGVARVMKKIKKLWSKRDRRYYWE